MVVVIEPACVLSQPHPREPCPRDRLLMPPIATRGARDRPGGGHLLRDARDQAAGRVPRRQFVPGAHLAGAQPAGEEVGEERGVGLAIVGVMGAACTLWRRWWGAAIISPWRLDRWATGASAGEERTEPGAVVPALVGFVPWRWNTGRSRRPTGWHQ